MMWTSTIFQFYQNLSINILAYILRLQLLRVWTDDALILSIFKILKIHCNYFWLDLLNKCTAVYLEISFSKTLYHIETSQLIFKANWLVSECYQFLLKGISEQNLVPRPLVNPPEVLRLCIRSCSIKRSGKRPPQKRSSL